MMAATAVFGGNRTAAEFCLAGVLNIPVKELAEFFVTWHLRALEAPERQIARVLQIAINAAKAEAGATRRR